MVNFPLALAGVILSFNGQAHAALIVLMVLTIFNAAMLLRR